MVRGIFCLAFLFDCFLCILSQGSPQLWDQMSDMEKMHRLKDLQRRIFFEIKNKGGNSGYGAPQQSSYNVPTAPAPSYNAPKPSYNAPKPSYKPQAPSYKPPAPSYNPPKPSYGGKGKGGGKVVEIPIPDIPLPNPADFKAGVLRSKGRIASGLLHTKAGILRAGANLLAQKANALDKFAQAIPALKANLIKGMTGGKGNTGYGAPAQGYGAPPPSKGYNAPKGPSYNQQLPAARPPSSYSPGNNNNNILSSNTGSISNNNLGNSFNGNGNGYSTGNSNSFSSGNSFGTSAGNTYSTGNSNSFSNSGNSFSSNNGNSFSSNNGNSFSSNSNGNNFAQPVQQTFRPSNTDSYGSPQGDIITSNSAGSSGNSGGNIPVSTSLSFGNNNQFSSTNNQQFSNSNGYNSNSNNGFSSSGQQQTFNNNNNGFSNSLGSYNNNNNQFSGSNSVQPANGNSNGLNPRLNPTNTNTGISAVEDDFTPLIESTLDQVNQNSVRSVRPGQQTQINLNGLDQSSKLLLQEARTLGLQGTCQAESSSLSTLLKDIFMGNEVIPDVIDTPPQYPLDLTYKTIRTFPGMRLTADMTRFKPMLKWPAQPDSLYTIVISNLDINSRRNRTLSEFWHWFVANIPGDSVDDGEVVFDLLFPLVLPEGDGDHRYGYFVFEQPRQLDYRDEGGPTDSCSPQMSNGRGPFKSTKNFMKKYNLRLTAATFIILDTNDASMEIACEWQQCIGNTINLVSPLQCNK